MARLVPALAAVALLALVAIGGASSNRGTSDAQLLRTYQPVLVFHPAEQLRPTKAQSFVNDSELERFTGSSLDQLPFGAFWSVVDPDPDTSELPAPHPGAASLRRRSSGSRARSGRCSADAGASRTTSSPDPAGADPGGSRADRARTRQPREPAELAGRDRPRLAGGRLSDETGALSQRRGLPTRDCPYVPPCAFSPLAA
jgi:hypothetical protein